MNAIDYIASVLSYFIVAIPIIAGNYSTLSAADLGSLISKVCM